jgi:hypothetical protein
MCAHSAATPCTVGERTQPSTVKPTVLAERWRACVQEALATTADAEANARGTIQQLTERAQELEVRRVGGFVSRGFIGPHRP